MYTLFEYKTKYQEEEVTKIKSMLFQAIAGYTLRKYEKAPAKRSQHANTTCHNIVGRNMLRAFGHRVATCCDMLGVVGSSLKLVKFEPTTPNMSQHIATRWPNARNMLRPTMLRYSKCFFQKYPHPDDHTIRTNVAICWVGMLRSFGWGLRTS